MRLFIFITTLGLLSCGQNAANKEPGQKDTAIKTVVQKDTVVKTGPQFYTCPGETAVNASLSKKFDKKWHVMNDREGKWIKDAFDYFIVSKRKEYPDYPYITTGDFNDDGKTDTAAVVRDEKKKEFRVAILLSNGKIQLWEDDVLINAALSTIPKGEAVEGGDIDHPKKIKIKVDGINVEYFEQASFVVYWSKGSFKRIQTGD
ncbi:MAG: hypothetical protein HOP10_12560 [Chitinophagaceae bacterium]|nr:hypothetical protein [Chitinophagaceae bacterium]